MGLAQTHTFLAKIEGLFPFQNTFSILIKVRSLDLQGLKTKRE